MKEREAAGNGLMDTTVGEGNLSQIPSHVMQVSCPITKVSLALVPQISDMKLVS